MYRANLGIIRSYESANNSSPDVNPGSELYKKLLGEISSDMKLEDLLRIYDQEKIKFLSSFVGQVRSTLFNAENLAHLFGC